MNEPVAGFGDRLTTQTNYPRSGEEIKADRIASNIEGVINRDDKQKCVDVWEMFTGEVTEAEQWNENAADALAVMVASIKECSSAMNFVPRPCGSNPGWSWITRYVHGVLQNRCSTNRGRLYEICIVGAGSLKRNAGLELVFGG